MRDPNLKTVMRHSKNIQHKLRIRTFQGLCLFVGRRKVEIFGLVFSGERLAPTRGEMLLVHCDDWHFFR